MDMTTFDADCITTLIDYMYCGSVSINWGARIFEQDWR